LVQTATLLKRPLRGRIVRVSAAQADVMSNCKLRDQTGTRAEIPGMRGNDNG
jgi:hypothetical protein